jgi:hypothetical protein
MHEQRAGFRTVLPMIPLFAIWLPLFVIVRLTPRFVSFPVREHQGLAQLRLCRKRRLSQSGLADGIAGGQSPGKESGRELGADQRRARRFSKGRVLKPEQRAAKWCTSSILEVIRGHPKTWANLERHS